MAGAIPITKPPSPMALPRDSASNNDSDTTCIKGIKIPTAMACKTRATINSQKALVGVTKATKVPIVNSPKDERYKAFVGTRVVK